MASGPIPHDQVLSVMAFHEKAGLCQVDFDLPFLKSTFLPSGGFAERHGAVRGAFCAPGAEALTARTALPPFRSDGSVSIIAQTS
jgi:hypothetical protein